MCSNPLGYAFEPNRSVGGGAARSQTFFILLGAVLMHFIEDKPLLFLEYDCSVGGHDARRKPSERGHFHGENGVMDSGF